MHSKHFIPASVSFQKLWREFLPLINLSRKNFEMEFRLPRMGQALVPATCGELIQGTIGKTDFLVNAPISYYAHIQVALNDSGEVKVSSPGTFTKVRRAVIETLKLLGLAHIGATIEVVKAIPAGKGMASSTAEMTAAICATARALQRPKVWEDKFVEILLGIDHSTDSNYLPGVVCVKHLMGVTLESFSDIPPLSFIIVDTGGEIDTASFDRERARKVARRHERCLTRALEALRLGFHRRNSRMVAWAATQSAYINQEVLPKDYIEELLASTVAFGGLGVNCAHTGTVLGVMFDPTQTNGEALRERVETLVRPDQILGIYPLISGGVKD